MRAADFGGDAQEAHAPAPSDLVRASLASADDYTPAASRVLADAWDYETQVPVADAPPAAAAWRSRDADDSRWTVAVGRRHGGAQRALVARGRTF